MHDFDTFERHLASALRADADESVGPFEAETVARAAIDGTVRGVASLHRSTRRAGRFGRGRGITLLAAAALLVVSGALAMGSGILRLPSVTPPAPAPSFALVTTPSPAATASPRAIAAPTPITRPSPGASETPSPTPLSLNLTWTKVALDDTDPKLAWVGDRYILVDEDSGRVRTSIDGSTWETLQPGDPDPGYADLMRQRLASWQGDAVGWWNEEDGPDTTAKPPANPRHIVTVVHPPAVPIATKSFNGEIESVAIGPKGIVAEVHSLSDPSQNPGYDPGFAWYSPTGKHWTQMARRTTSSDSPGARLPTGGFGQVVGVSDGFIASGDGMWYSADGLTWRLLGHDDSGNGLLPWMGGALARQGAGSFGLWTEAIVTNGAGHFDFWTSDGLSRLPAPADLHGIVGTGPLGLVTVAYGDQKAFVSRNGIDYGSSPIPAEMAHDNLGGTAYPPHVVVGDRNVVVLERRNDESTGTITWSLWVGAFEP
jgi:hypothetical protein